MDIRQLECLVAVTEELNFGRAATRLHMAQSALSRQILLLERELGARLIERNKRAPIRLTEAGTRFLLVAREAAQSFRHAAQTGRRLGRGELGLVRVGYVASAMFSSLLSTTTDTFRRKWPDVEIAVTEMESPRQIEALAYEDIDIGFLRPRATYPEGIATRLVLREPVMIALRADHALARQPAIAVGDLAGNKFIVPQAQEEFGFAHYTATIARHGGFALEISHRVRDFVSVLGLVGLGFGIAVMPNSWQRVRPAEIVYRPLSGCAVFAELTAAFRTGERSPAVLNFIRTLHALPRPAAEPGEPT